MYFNIFRTVLVLISIFALQAANASPLPDRDGDKQSTLSALCTAVWQRITMTSTPWHALLSKNRLRAMINRLPPQFWNGAHELCFDRETSVSKDVSLSADPIPWATRLVENHKASVPWREYRLCIADCVEKALISMAKGESWDPAHMRIKTMNELAGSIAA